MLSSFTHLFSKFRAVGQVAWMRSLSSIQKPSAIPSLPYCSPVVRCQSDVGSPLLQRVMSPICVGPLCTHESVRTNVRIHYRPNALKRINKHGLQKRLSKTPQREILFRRIIKGRHNLTVFDRFLNELPEKRVKGQKRVNLFDPKTGYKSAVKKPEYFKFVN